MGICGEIFFPHCKRGEGIFFEYYVSAYGRDARGTPGWKSRPDQSGRHI